MISGGSSHQASIYIYIINQKHPEGQLVHGLHGDHDLTVFNLELAQNSSRGHTAQVAPNENTKLRAISCETAQFLTTYNICGI